MYFWATCVHVLFDSLVINAFEFYCFPFDAFKALGWDPPRVMGTAFMFYSNTNEWAAGLEGWHGVDQLGDDDMAG